LAYAALLRAHIEKDKTVLFAMADRFLSPKEQRDMAKGFLRHTEARRPAATAFFPARGGQPVLQRRRIRGKEGVRDEV
jgi:hypothetical protein